MEVLLFGQLAELVGGTSIQVDPVKDTEQLLQLLKAHYPALHSARFTIAVNNQVTHQNTPLPEGAKIALLPPFSGG